MSTEHSRRLRKWLVHNPGDIGRAIAGVRAERGLTQAQLAEELGIDRAYLARLESDPDQLVLERAILALRRMGATVTVSLPSEKPDG
ncbi:MAG TPA: helix-turn-helix transcriptional regulator [Solirubrobacterales bacterium]|nr:helix-turn-helix transcriptional regulator [Solirubrobacterales bacterium]